MKHPESMSVPWREAWHDALYGTDGFFLQNTPAEHFSTSVNANPLFAEAVLALIRREGLTTVVDIGAGAGELLSALHRLDQTLELHGIELSGRPDTLDPTIGWSSTLPERINGLLIANEWLDNIPCDVVELDDDGIVRLILVDPSTGVESLGPPCDSTWLDDWWPLSSPGHRAEVGEPRDRAWADAVARVNGIALAIDYTHTKDHRPPFGSLRSYANGQEVDVLPDGSRDLTAHVAIDSVAETVTARVMSQRQALADLGFEGERPPLDLARADPQAYVHALTRASQIGELRARSGWGDFMWAVTDTRAVEG